MDSCRPFPAHASLDTSSSGRVRAFSASDAVLAGPMLCLVSVFFFLTFFLWKGGGVRVKEAGGGEGVSGAVGFFFFCVCVLFLGYL